MPFRPSRHWLLFSTMLSLLLSGNLHADDNLVPGDNAAAMRAEMTKLFTQLYEHMFQRQLKSELTALRTKLSLSAEQVKVLEDAAAESLKAVAADRGKRHAATGQRGASVSQVEILPAEIIEAVLKPLADFASDEQVAAYRREFAVRRSLQKGFAVRGLVVSLDNRLALLKSQRDQIRKLLDANWKDAWTRSGGQFSHRTPTLPMDLPWQEITGVLTETQRDALTIERTPPETEIGLEALGPGSKPEVLKRLTDRFRGNLLRTITLHSEAVDRRCSLSDSQKKKLNVLSKKVIEDLVGERAAAQERVQNAFAARRPDVVLPSDVQFVSHSAAALLPQYEPWSVLVLSVLDDEQDEQFQGMHASRMKDRNEAILLQVGASLQKTLMLSPDQGRKLSTLLAARAPNDRAFHMMSPQLQQFLAAVPEAEYVGAIGESNWLTLKKQLEDARRRLESLPKSRPARAERLRRQPPDQ